MKVEVELGVLGGELAVAQAEAEQPAERGVLIVLLEAA
jgi:hypothetical protein